MWLNNINNDLSERELSGEEEQDRVKWRRLIEISIPTYKLERMQNNNIMLNIISQPIDW